MAPNGEVPPTDHLEPIPKPTEVLEDDYIRLKVDHFLKGPFYNCDKYSVIIEITNKTDAMVMIPHADVYFINKEVHKRVKGFPYLEHGAFGHLSMENPGKGVLLAGETKKIDADGAVFIPRTVYLSVTHSGSKEKLEMELFVSREEDVTYWTGPKHIDFSSADVGIDGVMAFQEGLEIANQYLESCRLCFATWLQHTSTRQGNGLDFVKVGSWFLLFSSPNSESVVIINCDSSGTRGHLMATNSVKEYASFLTTCSERPVQVSYVEALALVDSLDMIYDNVCNPLWLDAAGLVDGELHPVWCLPYVGRDYFQLHVDAYSGKLLSFDVLYQQLNLGPPWLYHVIEEPISATHHPD